jgi:hypothetical protein
MVLEMGVDGGPTGGCCVREEGLPEIEEGRKMDKRMRFGLDCGISKPVEVYNAGVGGEPGSLKVAAALWFMSFEAASSRYLSPKLEELDAPAMLPLFSAPFEDCRSLLTIATIVLYAVFCFLTSISSRSNCMISARSCLFSALRAAFSIY